MKKMEEKAIKMKEKFKFNVGDKITLKKNVKSKRNYTKDDFPQGVVTISERILEGSVYRLEEDKKDKWQHFSHHGWLKHAIEEDFKLVSKTQPKVKQQFKCTDEKFTNTFNDLNKFLKDHKFVISDKNLKGILASINLRFPLLLVGPTGCGKTELLTLISKFYDGYYDYASLNGSITIHDLTQERILAKDGSFTENDMVLARWLRNAKNKLSILHLDEVNAARPETLLAMHPIMDIKGELRLPYTDEVLPVTENALLVMSANEGDDYIGINAMNVAFTNRMIKIHLPYIQGKQLIKLLETKTDIENEHATMIVNTWSKYMTSKELEQPVVSIRVLEKWCVMSKLVGLKEAGRITFASLIAKDDEELIEIVEGDLFVQFP